MCSLKFDKFHATCKLFGNFKSELFNFDLQFIRYTLWICADTVNVAKMLIANGANVNAVDVSGYSSLHWAALNGKLLYVSIEMIRHWLLVQVP